MPEPSFTWEATTPLWRRLLPWLIGAICIAALLAAIDLEAVAASLQRARLGTFALLAFAFVIVLCLIEAANLDDLLRVFGHKRPYPEVLAARAYTYLLMLLNYALGVAGFGLYVRNRAAVSAARASSLMLYYAHCEMLALCVLTLLGAAAFLDEPVLRSVALAAVVYLVGSQVLLRLLASGRLPYGQSLRASSLLSCLLNSGAARTWRIAAGRAGYFAVFILFIALTLPSFGLDVPLPVLAATVPAIFLIGNLPVTAAGLGTIQAAMLYFFAPFGDYSDILAYGVCYSAALIVFRIPLGVLGAMAYPGLWQRLGPTQASPH